jgi:hypothetical protein
MENAMKILQTEKLGPITYETLHIYEISKGNIQLNDNFAETYNPIYDVRVIMATYQSIGNEEPPS